MLNYKLENGQIDIERLMMDISKLTELALVANKADTLRNLVKVHALLDRNYGLCYPTIFRQIKKALLDGANALEDINDVRFKY